MMTQYPRLGEQLYSSTLENGLTVYVVPRPGFTKKMAYFVTDFGSVHNRFRLDDREITVPAGIAHFLEHKLFDLPQRDVSAEFAAMGANVNAFTSYDMTAYHFSCTENFEKSLALLLEFVSTPYFTQESVEKEWGIIDQEIGMHADSPDSRNFELLMGGMFRRFPMVEPILGTSDSIRQITPELLHLCHRAFYTPSNMVLCVVGDVQPQTVEAIARQTLGTEYRAPGEKIRDWQEEPTCPKQMQRTKLEVAMSTFLLGFRCGDTRLGDDGVLREIVGDLAAEALFGESSQLYLKLYDSGLIDSSFGGGFEVSDCQSLLICGGDSEDSEAVRDAILEEIRRLAREGISQEEFLRLRRSAMGRRIRDLDSFDNTCFRLCAYHISRFQYFRFPEIYARVTREALQKFWTELTAENIHSLSVIDPV